MIYGVSEFVQNIIKDYYYMDSNYMMMNSQLFLIFVLVF